VDDFWQQVAKFVFNVSNLLFSQVSTLQTDTDKQWWSWKPTTPVWITSARPIFGPYPPSLGFDPYFGNH